MKTMKVVARNSKTGVPEIVMEFIWANGEVSVDPLYENWAELREQLLSEIDPTSEESWEASLDTLSKKYRGSYCWVAVS